MKGEPFFRDYRKEKDDVVYVLFRSVATCANVRDTQISYSIAEYVVMATGWKYLTVKPREGGIPVRFGRLPETDPARGLWLVEMGDYLWPRCLFPTMKLARRYKAIQEKADAKRKAQARR